MTLVQPKTVIDGTAVNLKSLLNNINIIPNYQRDYVWEKDQVETLWDDLTSHYKKYCTDSEKLINPDGYFLGAMVVISKEENIDEVVDGQQRLTTLSTIAAICYEKICEDKNQDDEVEAWKNDLKNILSISSSGKFSPKIQFSDIKVQDFFLNSIFIQKNKKQREQYWENPLIKDQLTRKKSSYYRIKESLNIGYGQLDKFLKEVKPSLRRRRLLSFIALLIEGVVLLRIKAMSYANAYILFESLNFRGMPLAQSDLIKNEILKKLNNDDDVKYVADNWRSIRQKIESVPIKKITMHDFVHYSYLSRHKYIKAKDLYEEVKDITKTSIAAKKYSEELKSDAQAFLDLTKNFDSKWTQDTCNMLKDIKDILNIKHCYPYLICAYNKHAKNPSVFESHVRIIMNYAFRYMKIIGGTLESFTREVVKACSLIRNDSSIEDIKDHFKSTAPDNEFIKYFKEASFSNTKLSYYIVYHLEKSLLNGTEPTPHGIEQNLEHIMPKTPSEADWPKAFELKNINNNEYKEKIWMIGNLLPLPANINKSLKNFSIQRKISNDKKIDYTSDCHNLISPKKISDFLENNDWTFNSIIKRQEYIANELANKTWSL